MAIKKLIRSIPDYPKPGIMFRDITTLIKDPIGLNFVIKKLSERYAELRINKIAGIESRGFIIGAPLAYELGVGFIPIRKKGKLPAKTIGCDYALEYGTDRIEIHVDAISPGENILLIDDLIATGGTAEAAVTLIKNCGGIVAECAFVVDLPDLGGKSRLEKMGVSVFSLTEFDGH
ncbi:adenine phosphoribosyltransferase [Polynucleobacter paneuropaeus]|jgi:adenine phosphoribosyltransferase|nr:adenine phosphoribosyltransferase [Polynucleobacter paneuropaeus]MBT8637572.1 adenine phosphoribosyltransferase [Polynucleobacter paneuropaeus]